MAKKKKRPSPPRSDTHLIERLRKVGSDILKAEVDFDAIVDAVLIGPDQRRETGDKHNKPAEKPKEKSRYCADSKVY